MKKKAYIQPSSQVYEITSEEIMVISGTMEVPSYGTTSEQNANTSRGWGSTWDDYE